MLEQLELLANMLQVMTYIELMSQANNDDLLRELQHQNKQYLEKIIEQNEVLIEQNIQIQERLNNGSKTNL